MRCCCPALPGQKNHENCLDLGCGNGIIPILMEAKTDGKYFTGLEIQPESADMARRSVALNDLQDRIDIVEGDIKDASKIFGASSFHVVTTNPPYMTAQHGLTNLHEAKPLHAMRYCAIWKILSGRARAFWCRVDVFIWYTAHSVWQRSFL